MKEYLGTNYIETNLESFWDSLIREKYKLIRLGVIIIVDTSRKSLVAQQKNKTKNPNKQHSQKSNKKRVPIPLIQVISIGDKGTK